MSSQQSSRPCDASHQVHHDILLHCTQQERMLYAHGTQDPDKTHLHYQTSELRNDDQYLALRNKKRKSSVEDPIYIIPNAGETQTEKDDSKGSECYEFDVQDTLDKKNAFVISLLTVNESCNKELAFFGSVLDKEFATTLRKHNEASLTATYSRVESTNSHLEKSIESPICSVSVPTIEIQNPRLCLSPRIGRSNTNMKSNVSNDAVSVNCQSTKTEGSSNLTLTQFSRDDVMAYEFSFGLEPALLFLPPEVLLEFCKLPSFFSGFALLDLVCQDSTSFDCNEHFFNLIFDLMDEKLFPTLEDWLDNPIDSQIDISRSTKRWLDLQSLANGGIDGPCSDLVWWSYRDGSPPLRNLTKLRRVLAPIILTWRVTSKDGKNCLDPYPFQSERLDVSLVDLWLYCPLLRSRALQMLVQQARLLRQWNKNYVGSTECHYHYKRLERDLHDVICRTRLTSFHFLGQELNLNTTHVDHLLPLSNWQLNRKSYLENARLELLDIRHKKKQMLAAHTKGELSEDNNKTLYTAVDMTEHKFLEEAYFMNRVNQSIARPFNPLLSRSRMGKVSMSTKHIQNLKSILFRSDGSLNPEVVNDVTSSEKHNYISFSNAAGAGSGDYRWQIQFELHTGQRWYQTRGRIEKVLKESKLFNPELETVHDLGILIGGTEDQSIHHDIGRQWTHWLPSNTDDGVIVSTLGWENKRLVYNEILASEYAPCSIILGMSESTVMYLGVQVDQIERLGDNKCKIRCGMENDVFRIVREDQYLVVLEIETGCILGADFPHAGVRNVKVGSQEEKMLIKLLQRIDAIIRLYGEDRQLISKNILQMFCSFKGLNKLCRFHCSTEPKDMHIKIPRNMVGYSECCRNTSGGFSKTT